VSVFTGATGSAAGQYSIRGGGRLVVRAVYHEKSAEVLAGVLLNDRGTLSVDATRFSYATSKSAPTIGAEGFRGLFTLTTRMLLPVDTQETCRIETRGDGSGSSLLALCSQFWVTQPGTTAGTVWRNAAVSPAAGGILCCNINTSNKDAAPGGWAHLANVSDHADPARSNRGTGVLANGAKLAIEKVQSRISQLDWKENVLSLDAIQRQVKEITGAS
jgi:hypothetical protein